LKEVYGNIWHIPSDAICITTNGFVKSNGEAVMGAGIAKEAAKRFPVLPGCLGNLIKDHGNHVHVFWALYQQYEGESGGVISTDILSFPVKHNWFEMADMDLIRRSCRELMEVADELGNYWKKILLPRPGCGNGKLNWLDVKREIEPILDDRISVVTFYKS
jgi:hypothetical protein